VPEEWLTYVQIGERFGLKPEAARTRVRRLQWRTMPGNDGRTLALVPEDADLRPGGAHAGGPNDDRVGESDGDRPVTVMLTGLLTEVTARADRAEQRAAEANRRADVAVALADRTLAQLADAMERADRAEAKAVEFRLNVDAARAQAQTAQQETEALRRDLEAAQMARAEAEANAAERSAVAETRCQELAVAQHDAKAAQQTAAELRKADEARRARGRWTRLKAAWRGE
jgi:chromosome segregation ATPase